jgi:hypothetical protein
MPRISFNRGSACRSALQSRKLGHLFGVELRRPRDAFNLRAAMALDTIPTLLKVKLQDRDPDWEVQFLSALCHERMSLVQDQPVQGPDSWPYMMLRTGGDEPMMNLVRWASTRGIGFVVNPDQAMPDYVLTYGMIWNCRERGEFLTPAPEKSSELIIRDGEQLFAGPPSTTYLPEDVRQVLRDFLKRQRVSAPRVLMLSRDEKDWDLAFSIESLNSPPATEHAGIAEAVSWFLPAHYSVALVSERVVPGFVAL